MTKYFIDKEKDELIEIDKKYYINRYEYIAYILTHIDLRNILSNIYLSKYFIDDIKMKREELNDESIKFSDIKFNKDIYFKDSRNKSDTLKKVNSNFSIDYNIRGIDKMDIGKFNLYFKFDNLISKKYFNNITDNLVDNNGLVNEGIDKGLEGTFVHFESFEERFNYIKYGNTFEYDSLFMGPSIEAYSKNFIEEFKDFFFILIYQNNVNVLMTLYEIKYMYEDDIEFFINISNNIGPNLISILDLVDVDENDLFKELTDEKDIKNFKVKKGFL